MKRTLDEASVKRIYQHLLEKFGEPIGKAVDAGQGVADEKGGRRHKGVTSPNRGFGADLTEALCQHCGMMHDEGGACDEADAVTEMVGEPRGPKNDMGLTYEKWIAQVEHAAEKAGTVVQYGRHSRFAWQGNEDPKDYALGQDPEMDEGDDLDQKAPPGREKQVKALKKQRGVKNPYAVAWSQYNKKR